MSPGRLSATRVAWPQPCGHVVRALHRFLLSTAEVVSPVTGRQIACHMNMNKQTRCAAHPGIQELEAHIQDLEAHHKTEPEQTYGTLSHIDRCAMRVCRSESAAGDPDQSRLTAAAHTHTPHRAQVPPGTTHQHTRRSPRPQLLQGKADTQLARSCTQLRAPRADTQSPCSEQLRVHPAATEAAPPTYLPT